MDAPVLAKGNEVEAKQQEKLDGEALDDGHVGYVGSLYENWLNVEAS